jgi:hypothetical protein
MDNATSSPPSTPFAEAELTPHQARLAERMNAERKQLGLPLIPQYVPRADNRDRNRWTDSAKSET